jgi:hypothetical protein
MKLAIIQNEIAQGKLATNIEVPLELNGFEKKLSSLMIGAPFESVTST